MDPFPRMDVLSIQLKRAVKQFHTSKLQLALKT